VGVHHQGLHHLPPHRHVSSTSSRPTDRAVICVVRADTGKDARID
jgi:hypothetical protein